MSLVCVPCLTCCLSLSTDLGEMGEWGGGEAGEAVEGEMPTHAYYTNSMPACEPVGEERRVTETGE